MQLQGQMNRYQGLIDPAFLQEGGLLYTQNLEEFDKFTFTTVYEDFTDFYSRRMTPDNDVWKA